MFKTRTTTTRRIARLAAVAALGAAGIGTATAPADAFMLKVVPRVQDCGPYADQQPRPDMYLPNYGFYRGNIREIDDATICLMNNERAIRGQSHLSFNGELLNIADRHADYQQRMGFSGHIGENGSTEWTRTAPYRQGWSFAGNYENLHASWGQGKGTPRFAVSEWMKSTTGHKEAILSTEYKDVAVAARPSTPGPGGNYTVLFGFRR